MSQSPDAFLSVAPLSVPPLSVATDSPELQAPAGALETRRARRARIEALEASLRRDFGQSDDRVVPVSDPGAVAGMMRVNRSGIAFSDEQLAASHEPERA